MLTLPNCLIQNIFSYILKPYHVNLLNNVELKFEDIAILETKTNNHKFLYFGNNHTFNFNKKPTNTIRI